MHNELFSIGPFTVYGYGLMIAIGIFSAYCLAEYRARRLGLDDERVFGLTIWAVVGGILGGKILFYLTILPQIAADPSLLYRDLMEGFVIYGALIGGFLGIVLCPRWPWPRASDGSAAFWRAAATDRRRTARSASSFRIPPTRPTACRWSPRRSFPAC